MSAKERNKDKFIEALGLNPKDYEVILPDGTIAYDIDTVEALNKITPELWNDDEKEGDSDSNINS